MLGADMEKNSMNTYIEGRKTSYSIPDVMRHGMHIMSTTTTARQQQTTDTGDDKNGDEDDDDDDDGWEDVLEREENVEQEVQDDGSLDV